MPKGITGSCAFCALPSTSQDAALRAWRTGGSYGTIGKILAELGTPLSVAELQYCPCRSGHHDRGKPEDRAKVAAARLGKVADLLERSGIDPADISKVESVSLSTWEGLTKNDDGEAVITPLSGARIVLSPEWAEGPRWQPIDRAAKVPVTLPKPTRRKRRTKTAVVLPDSQIGYRRLLDSPGDLDPFHDEQAMTAALKVVQAVDPDDVIHVGDLLDFQPLSKYEPEALTALTVQPSLDRAHRWLAECVTAAPNARHALLEGNHDRRLEKVILNNAMAAWGLRRAAAPDEWPVLSIPYLLRLEELGVTYHGGYPAGALYLADHLAVIHGARVRSNGSTAAANVTGEDMSIVAGHVHRLELHYKTRRVRGGGRTTFAASVGCLCRIDGTVPSMKGSLDAFAKPIPSYEDWQQGLLVLTYTDDGVAVPELVPIHEGRVIFRGEDL